MKRILVLFSIAFSTCAISQAALAAYSGGTSTCKGVIKVTGTPTGNTIRVFCGGLCQSSSLGSGTCMLMCVGNGVLGTTSYDFYQCVCRFSNPFYPIEGDPYIILWDTHHVDDLDQPACDATGALESGVPEPDGTVPDAFCGLTCAEGGGICAESSPVSQPVPNGTTIEITCSCQ